MKWLILLSWEAQGFLQRIQGHHLTTDPACVHYVAPRPGSILDRWSRGLECEPCMVHRAFHFDDDAPWQGCTVPPEGWWCSREKGHEPPCAARPGKHPESGDLNRVKFDPPLTDAEADAFWAAVSDESESEGRESDDA